MLKWLCRQIRAPYFGRWKANSHSAIPLRRNAYVVSIVDWLHQRKNVLDHIFSLIVGLITISLFIPYLSLSPGDNIPFSLLLTSSFAFSRSVLVAFTIPVHSNPCSPWHIFCSWSNFSSIPSTYVQSLHRMWLTFEILLLTWFIWPEVMSFFLNKENAVSTIV